MNFNCYMLESTFRRLIHVLVDMWNTFVYVPWTLCSQGSCTWWCLCCNKWLCWIFLTLVAILTIFFWVMYAITVTTLLILCETLCVIGGILSKNVACFGNGNPDPGTGPYPEPQFPTPPVSPESPTKPKQRKFMVQERFRIIKYLAIGKGAGSD